MLGDNYQRPQGKRFGLDALQGWSMKAPLHMEDKESMNSTAMENQGALEETPAVAAVGQSSSENLRVETNDAIIKVTLIFPI